MSRFEIMTLSAMTALAVVVQAAGGHLAPHVMPDTASYLAVNASGFPAILAQPRAPFYGWLVALLDFAGADHAAVPIFNIATYLAAVWLVAGQLRAFGLSAGAVLSVAAALLLANAFLIDANWVHPELLSITCALGAIAGTVRLAGAPPRRSGWPLVCLGAACAYVLRPSFVPLIVTLPALYLALRAVRGEAPRLARAAAIALVAAAPFGAIASLRAATVGDPNVVSFGGFAMSGLATLMLDDEVVVRLPDDVKPFAVQVLAARRSGEDSGRFIGIPRNSSDQRSFYSVALGYFDALARTYDDMLYVVITPTRAPGEPWMDFNRRLMRFSLAVVRAAPGRYAAWVAGAATRMLGRSIATNLPAALAIVVIAVAWPWRLFRSGQTGVRSLSRLDVPVMAVLAILWLIGAGLLTMLVIAPSARYIETSSVLVAPLLIYWAVLLVAPRLAKPKSS